MAPRTVVPTKWDFIVRTFGAETHHGGAEVYDLTYLIGGGPDAAPVVTKAENRPGSAVFRITTPRDEAWTAMVGLGYYTEIAMTSGERIFAGYITSLEHSDMSVKVTCADFISVLEKQGTWLRRNYRKSGSTGTVILPAVIGADGTVGYDATLVPGTVTSVQYLVSGDPQDVPRSTDGGRTHVDISHGTGYVRGLTVPVRAGITEVQRPLSLSGKATYTLTATYTTEDGAKRSVSASASWSARDTGYHNVTLSLDLGASRGSGGVLDVTLDGAWSFDDPNATKYYAYYTSYNGTSQAVIDTLGTVAPVIPESDQESYDKSSRVRVTYTSGSVTAGEVMKEIVGAVGYRAVLPSSVISGSMAVFRAGGAYAGTYLRRLADTEASGHRLSYTGYGHETPSVYIGQRATVGDESYMLKYGMDNGADGLESIDMVSFLPSKTLKRRPSAVTLSAKVGDRAVMCTVEDLTSIEARNGLSVETSVTDASVSDMGDVGQSAYNVLRSKELDRWEGTVTLAGIVPMMHESDDLHAGSGEQVRVRDSRYHVDESVHVMQAVYDLNAYLTVLTIGNYSAEYSSSISESASMVVAVGQMAMDTASSDLSQQQYCYVRDLQPTWSSAALSEDRVLLQTATKLIVLGAPTIYAMPDGTAIIVAQGTAEPGGSTDGTDWGVTGIHVELKTRKRIAVSVPDGRRPDYLVGQTLTVCLRVLSP